MTAVATTTGQRQQRDYIVHAPRVTDAIGRSLRDAFGVRSMPDDLKMLLWRLDGAD